MYSVVAHQNYRKRERSSPHSHCVTPEGGANDNKDKTEVRRQSVYQRIFKYFRKQFQEEQGKKTNKLFNKLFSFDCVFYFDFQINYPALFCWNSEMICA